MKTLGMTTVTEIRALSTSPSRALPAIGRGWVRHAKGHGELLIWDVFAVEHTILTHMQKVRREQWTLPRR